MNHCKVSSLDLKQPTCLICQTDYNTEGEPHIQLLSIIDCSHIYHKICIEEWFKYNESCPICRKQLQQESSQPSLLQFILLFLSLQQQPYIIQDSDWSLTTHTTQTLASTAFTCVFLNTLLENHRTTKEYNEAKHRIALLKSTLRIDGESLPENVNLSSRTAVIREIKHRQTLMRCQLIEWIWTEADPCHLQEPPQLPHGRALYCHPYLQSWKRKIDASINTNVST